MRTTASPGLACVAVVAALAGVALAEAPAAAATRAFAVPGPKTVVVKDLSTSAQIAAPDSGGPYPLVVASHGFSASGANQIGWAKQFASWGLVVVVPTFPNSFAPDTATNAGIIEDLVTQLEGPLASAQGVAPGPFGVEGHSAGGLATAVAALKVSPAATVLFDPVDKNGDGKAAYAALCSPVLAIFAGPSGCNNNAEWRGFETSTPSSLLAFDVNGSTHCDGENADRGALCGAVCGGAASADRQAVYAHYATAFLLAHLTNDAAAKAALADATVDADTDIAGIHHAVATCSAPVGDGGADGAAPSSPSSPGDAGPTGSSGTPSGAIPGSGTNAADPGTPSSAPVPAGSTGCGCHATRAPLSPLGLGALALALATLFARSRSRSRSRSR